MKKITRTIAGLLLATQLQAQDTTCTMIRNNEVVEFNYYTSEIISKINTNKSGFIEVKDGEVLCLHLFDEKHRVRKVINTYPNGDVMDFALDSKSNVYFTTGPVCVEVRKPRLFILR